MGNLNVPVARTEESGLAYGNRQTAPRTGVYKRRRSHCAMMIHCASKLRTRDSKVGCIHWELLPGPSATHQFPPCRGVEKANSAGPLLNRAAVAKTVVPFVRCALVLGRYDSDSRRRSTADSCCAGSSSAVADPRGRKPVAAQHTMKTGNDGLQCRRSMPMHVRNGRLKNFPMQASPTGPLQGGSGRAGAPL